MLSAVLVTLVAIAGAVAFEHTPRSGSQHAAVSRRMDSSLLDKRVSTFSGRTTWYPTDTGPDACTGKNHLDSDYYVAMNMPQSSQCCGNKLSITYQGKTATATCVDFCASCPEQGQIDLTKDLFLFFTGDLDLGEFTSTWHWITGDDSGDDDTTTQKPTTSTKAEPKTTTKKATTTHTTTHTTPTTTHTTTHHTTSSPVEAEEPTTTHTTHTEKPTTTHTTHKAVTSTTPKETPSSTEEDSSSSSTTDEVSSTSTIKELPTSTSSTSTADESSNTGSSDDGGVANAGGDSATTTSGTSDADTTGGISGALGGSNAASPMAQANTWVGAVFALLALFAL